MARVTQERIVTPTSLASAVDALMPQLTTDLIALTRIPSISESSFPAQPVHDACKLVMKQHLLSPAQRVSRANLLRIRLRSSSKYIWKQVNK